MKNQTRAFPESHETVLWTNTTGSDVAAGAVVSVNGRYGVTAVPIKNNASGAVVTAGEFKLTKGTGYTLAVGQRWTWDSANSRVVAAAGTQTDVGGIVAEAAATNDTTVVVRLADVPPRVFNKAHVASAGEDSANQADIVTGWGANPTGAVVILIKNTSNVYRVPAGAVTFPVAGTIRVADANLAVNEVIHVVAYE